MLAGRTQSDAKQPTVLLLITDVDGLFTANPSVVASAAPIRHLRSEDITQLRQRMMSGVVPLCDVNSEGTAEIDAHGAAVDVSTPSAAAEDTGGAGSSFGTGGMQTKLQAAALASASGVLTGIVNNTRIEQIPGLLATLFPEHEPDDTPASDLIKRVQALDHGTWCLPSSAATTRILSAHKRWLLSIPPMGRLTVDAGAAKALVNKHSLYAAGCTHVHGVFNSSDMVRVMDENQVEIARALVSYSSAEMRELLGQHSGDIEELLGHAGPESVAHRGNIVLLAEK
jgi:glutamate 5-kinase